VLNSLILGKLQNRRSEVLLRPSIGEDCSAVDFGREICIISTDPITGTENQIGTIGVNVALNDLASSGAEPVGITVTLLIPPDASMSDVEKCNKPAGLGSFKAECGYHRRAYRSDRCG